MSSTGTVSISQRSYENASNLERFPFSDCQSLILPAFAKPSMNFKPGHTRRFWWAALAMLLTGELFVFLRTIPEKRRWAAEPVLTLDLPDTFRGEPGAYEFVEQPERLGGAVEQLAFAKGRCGVFSPIVGESDNRRTLDFFYFEYDPGNPRFIHDVFGVPIWSDRRLGRKGIEEKVP